MASYPSPPTSPRKLDENPREDATKTARDLTDGGCSRNVFTWRRGSDSAPEEPDAEVGKEEEDELSESEARQDGWYDEEQQVTDAVHAFMNGPQATMARTYWKNKGEDVVCEA